MKSPSKLPGLSSEAEVPLNPFQEEISRLKKFIFSSFLLGGLFFSVLTACLSLYLHTKVLALVVENVRVSMEESFSARSENEVMTDVLSNRKVVSSICKKWWFDMDHTQRKIAP